MKRLIALALFASSGSFATAAEPAQAPAAPSAQEVKAASKTEGDFSNEATETAEMPVTSEKPAPKKASTPASAASKPSAPAEAKPKGKYEGMFTFDWKRLTKCQIVGPITNAMLVDPKNVCKKGDRSTGSPASCKVSDKSEYLIFRTLDDCKVEYEEQLKASP